MCKLLAEVTEEVGEMQQKLIVRSSTNQPIRRPGFRVQPIRLREVGMYLAGHNGFEWLTRVLKSMRGRYNRHRGVF